MENLETISKIETWLNGSRDYQQGKTLLATIPDAWKVSLQLSWMETYESRIRLYKALNDCKEILKNGN